MNCPIAVKKSKGSKPDKWEIEDAARALIRAEEIKQNPDLLKLALKELENQAMAAKKARDAAKSKVA